jgi:inner membrane transporter RhtA
MSLDTLPIGIAIAIEFTGPLTVAIVSSRKPLDFLWIVLAITGLAFLLPITPGTVSLNPIGVAFAFAAATFWALYIVFGKRVGHLPAGATTSYGMMIGGILLFPFGITHVGAKILDPNILISALGLAIASSAIPYTLEMYALKRLPRNTFSILLSLEPAVGAISGMLILSEHLSIQQWIAIASVMLASIGSAVSSKTHETVSDDSIEAADAEIVA